MAVYFLKHPRPDFTGVMGGVDFYQGQGSTSSLRDARGLSERGCTIFDEAERRLQVEAHIDPESRLEILKAKTEAPKIELPDKGEADASPASLSVEPIREKKKPGRKPKAIK
jgi:hypothetical protein